MNDAMGDPAAAVQLLRAQQNAYYIEAVQRALEAEEQRKARLAKVSTHLEAKRLEKQFARDRARDKQNLLNIQEDHALLLRAKVDELEHGGAAVVTSTARSTARTSTTARTVGASEEPKAPVKLSKERLAKLSMPRVTATKQDKVYGETSQELEFYKTIYRKHDRARLGQTNSLPALNGANLNAMSDVELLHRKANLLSELHGVVSMQERILQDDQWTVRSSVSSWKSSVI